MFLPAIRVALPIIAFLLFQAVAAYATPLTFTFTAQVGSSNDIDTGNVFGEGVNANLAGQIITGSVTIDPATLTQLCSTGGACYADFGAGDVTVSFTLNGITSTTVSGGTTGYDGNRSGGSVLICDPSDGGNNYLEVGAASPDGMVQQSIGALFSPATLLSAYGNGDAQAAIDSLYAIGGGGGLATGGITYLSPIEHLDATLLTITMVPNAAIPEPAALAVLGAGLVGLLALRRRRRP